MSDYFQPAEDNGETLSKIILLILGIFIGAVVMGTVCYFGGIGRGPQITHVDGAGPGAANAMENLSNGGPAQAPEAAAPAYTQQAGMVPQGMPAAPQYAQPGMPIVMPDQMVQTEVYTQPDSTPTTLYAGQMIDDEGHRVGRNGLRGNPCVDPPSCRGRAYSGALQ